MPLSSHVLEALINGGASALVWGLPGATVGAMRAEKGHRLHGALRGGAVGGILGGTMGGAAGALNSVMKEKLYEQERAWRAAEEAARNQRGAHADPFEDFFGFRSHTSQGVRHSEPSLHEVAPWLRDVRTKAEAKTRFRQQARANHPDTGGSADAMKKINEQWDNAQKHPSFKKLSHVYETGERDALVRFGVR